MAEPEMLTTAELAERLRVSRRQLHYWAHEGLLPTLYGAPGSGVRRLWSPGEARRAQAFAALVHAGVDPRAVGDAMRSILIGDELFVAQLGELVVTGPLP